MSDRKCARCGHGLAAHLNLAHCVGGAGDYCGCRMYSPAPPRELSAVTGAFIAGALAGIFLAALVWWLL